MAGTNKNNAPASVLAIGCEGRAVGRGLGTLVLRHLFLLRRRIGGTRAKRSILSVIVPADGTSAATV